MGIGDHAFKSLGVENSRRKEMSISDICRAFPVLLSGSQSSHFGQAGPVKTPAWPLPAWPCGTGIDQFDSGIDQCYKYN